MQVAQSLPVYVAPGATFGAQRLPMVTREALAVEVTALTSPTAYRVRAGLTVALGALAGLAAFALGVALNIL